MSDGLTVDREFSNVCRRLTIEERAKLESQIERDGCLDPIIVWANHNDTIIDGHHRYEICQALGIPFKVKALKFDSREEVIEWIGNNQEGRRNETEEEKAHRRGKLYLAQKKESHRPGKGAHDAHLNGKTASKLAAQFDVDQATIRRDAKFAEAVDELATNVGREVKDEILSGRSGLSKKEVVAIANEPAESQAKAIEVAKRDKPRTGEVKTDVEKLIEGIDKLIERVNALAAHRMGHNAQSRAVVATLKTAIKQSKAMARSWRNE